jgi:hypothetical protein
MNPFVNPKKRGVTLPKGCKDLVDVLKHSEPNQSGAIHRFICSLLAQAQQEQATEIVIGVASTKTGTPVRYKIQDTWYDLTPFPSHIRPDVMLELARLARFPRGQILGEGVLDESFGEMRLRWIVAMTSADGECMLNRVQD